MKKVKIVTATLVMALTCAACSGGTSNAPAANSQAPEDFKPITLRYANQHSIDHTATLAAQAAAEEIHEKTDGRITFEVYPANQLGDWTQVYEEVMMGTIDVANTTVPETYDARANASMLPYLANSYAELDKAMGPDSYLAGKMVDIQAAQGIKFLGYSCEGFAGIGTSKPVPNPNEVGAASAMAAGGLAWVMGGTPEQSCQAASCALQNILGTICDPVAGLVQIPCINRNAMSAANSVVSANMVMGGFDPLIPLDQAAETLFRVGKQLPSELRCTCAGGLCITPCGQRLAEEQEIRDSAR